ncbi:MAG TPA: class I SAM-dependent methyltransferase [Pyrinomonadaceae bacterium]|jgi:SAM-dependent methyltransferase|nr:class I SAM-dependent methyltransferase [Pyrinomonadaceae bacterium]
MDEIAKYNIERWRALAAADALFTRPARNLDADSSRRLIDPEGILGELKEKRVLCLASGGGSQSAAFALLGALVTVFDISEEQLHRDREMAAHYGTRIEAVQGDMRDLSQFDENAFDLVFHAYSLNFVPDARAVFREVARVLRAAGMYQFMCANPFYFGLGTKDWDGGGYALKARYVDGAVVTNEDQIWVYGDGRGERGDAVPGSREYLHTFSTLTNGLIEQGFVIRHVSERISLHADYNAEPGTWDHFVSVAPPWLSFWATKRPDVFAGTRAKG